MGDAVSSILPLDVLAPDGIKRRSVHRMPPVELVPPALWYKSDRMANEAARLEQYTTKEKLSGYALAMSPRYTSVDRTGAETMDNEYGNYSPDTNSIHLSVANGATEDTNQHTYPHEIGHALWDHTLPEFIKDQWNHIHTAQLNNVDENGLHKLNSVGYYPDDPSHSFADAFGMYVGEPETMESQVPAVYNWFRAVVGREYKKRDAIEQQSPAAQVPFYWGSLK